MSKNNIESKIEELIEPVINKLNYELYDVQYVKEGKDYYLRIIIDKTDGISIEDCEKVNNEINDLLDEVDYIKESYFLEVSSPGIERLLSKPWHYEKQIGNKINIKLYKPIDKKKEFEGILKSYNQDELELEVDDNKIKIENKNIATARTVADAF